RLLGSRALKQAVTDGLADAQTYAFSLCMVQLAGALWHGSGLLPPQFADFSDALSMWPAEGRSEYAIACARIGGPEATEALARLIRDGHVPADAGWIGAASHAGTLEAIRYALLALSKDPSTEKGSPEAGRLAAALAALKKAGPAK
ncbi:MAG TPA: hypothetical protein VHF22_10340, partial [Planctomycetota bacterium]|nr:hypothetical protein [Planctomycetota bacterium]